MRVGHQRRFGWIRLGLSLALLQSAFIQTAGAQSDSAPGGRAEMIHVLEPSLEVSIQGFEAKIRAQAEDLPGAAAVLIIDGNVRPLMLFGFQSMADIRPITKSTIFQLASLSKSFAATAIALAVNDGRLQWGAPLASLLPELNWSDARRGKKLKLFHLANQSSGLMPHAYTNLVEDVVSYNNMLNRLQQVSFVCDPGACYSYQNVAFSLLGDVLTQATGIPYAQFVEQRLFAPLNMQAASVGRATDRIDQLASAHVLRDDRWAVVPRNQRYYKVAPAAGVNASIADMQQWLLAHLGLIDGVPHAPIAELQSRYIANEPADNHYPNDHRISKAGYGLGWRVFAFSGVDGFTHHGGYVRGMRSEMIFHRGSKSGLVFLTNSEPAALNRLSLAFAEWLVALQNAETLAWGDGIKQAPSSLPSGDL
ncbi:MAG: serine hydrolase [Pseudomonadales bacterium]|nr:serine hydrolase [Pseudomonadales bacterium]